MVGPEGVTEASEFNWLQDRLAVPFLALFRMNG
jgi:hypothetical protein